MIWQAFERCKQQRMATDYISILSNLSDAGQLEQVGGSLYVSSLINIVPTAIHAKQYAAIVKEKAERRAMIKIAGEIAGVAYDESSDIEQARTSAMMSLSNAIRARGAAEPVSHYAGQLLAEIDTARNFPQEVYGIPTGFYDIDRTTKGLHRGEVLLLCGEPGAGKSLLAGQIAFNAACADFTVAIYALEMKAIANVRRMISSETRILTSQMRSGYLSEDEYTHIIEKLTDVSKLPLWLSDETQWTTATMRADVARLKAQHGLDLVVIDYISLLKDAGFDPNDKDKIISQGIHDLAKDFDVSVLAVHTLNKVGIRNGALSLADAGGSVKIIYDADVAAFLTKHLTKNGEQPQENVRTLSFLKYREDDPDRYLHLVKAQVNVAGKLRGLPRFESYQGGY